MFKSFMKRLDNKKGFTLIELIVVIAILGTLLAIAVPKFSGFRESVAEKADDATAAVIANAANMYYLAYDILPSKADGNTGGTENDHPKKIGDLTVEELKNKGYLKEGTYEPQQKDKTEFKIELDTNTENIIVKIE